MAVARAVMIVVCLIAFFIVAVPLQWACRWSGLPAPAWVVRLFCRLLLIILGVRVVEGAGVRGRAMRLVVANHVSWLDILVVGSREPLCFLAKRDVESWPIVSAFARLQDTVFVDRARRRQIPRANRDMADRLRRGRAVLLFPEGTTHDGTRRGKFLTSHLACLRDLLAAEPELASCSVQAVALAYSDPVAAWVGDATLLPHLWSVLRRPTISCTVAHGPEIKVERGHDRKALGRALAADIEALLEAQDWSEGQANAFGPAVLSAAGV